MPHPVHRYYQYKIQKYEVGTGHYLEGGTVWKCEKKERKREEGSSSTLIAMYYSHSSNMQLAFFLFWRRPALLCPKMCVLLLCCVVLARVIHVIQYRVHTTVHTVTLLARSLSVPLSWRKSTFPSRRHCLGDGTKVRYIQ